jgi:hypothetical protein
MYFVGELADASVAGAWEANYEDRTNILTQQELPQELDESLCCVPA